MFIIEVNNKEHNAMTKDEHYQRLRAFSIRIIKLVDAMPNTVSSIAIAKQIVRSGTSPAANYHAACKGKSDKDFLNKLKMVEEELDESLHWLSIISETEMLPPLRLSSLMQECEELLRMTTSSIITMRKKLSKDSSGSKS